MMGLLGDSFPLDPQTMAWVAKVVSTGGTVTQSRKIVANTLITSLRAGGLLSILDRLWILGFADVDTIQAKTDLINLATWTQGGSGTLGAGGWTGNGTTGYLDSNFNPATANGNWQANGSSLSYGVYNKSSTTTTPDMMMGSYGGAGTTVTQFYLSGGAAPVLQVTSYASVNDAGTPSNTTATLANIGGRWISTRTSGTGTSAIYLNGSDITLVVGSNASATASLNLYIGGRNNNTVADSFSADQLAMAFIGGGMNSTQAGNFDAAIASCMTSLGI